MQAWADRKNLVHFQEVWGNSNVSFPLILSIISLHFLVTSPFISNRPLIYWLTNNFQTYQACVRNHFCSPWSKLFSASLVLLSNSSWENPRAKGKRGRTRVCVECPDDLHLLRISFWSNFIFSLLQRTQMRGNALATRDFSPIIIHSHGRFLCFILHLFTQWCWPPHFLQRKFLFRWNQKIHKG